jgi:hypothetical protein
MQNLIAVLYSKEQKCWHIESLNEYMESNIRFLLGIQKVQQYKLVIVFDEYKDASKFINDNQDKFN